MAIAAAGLLVIHMVLLASAPPIERRLRIHVADWPASARPLRIALLSDLHVATPSDSPRHLAHVVQTINARKPDLVLIAGDMLATDTDLVEPATVRDALQPLTGLRAPLGIIAVLGNHDYDAEAAIRKRLPQIGVTLLDNDAARRGAVTIVGISDIVTGHSLQGLALKRSRPLGGLPIVLSHSPDISPWLHPSLRLVLAGHTHCGQIAPWPIGPILTASMYGKRYSCGLIREGQRLTLVSSGIGTSLLPFRLGAAPDYWVIDLGP